MQGRGRLNGSVTLPIGSVARRPVRVLVRLRCGQHDTRLRRTVLAAASCRTSPRPTSRVAIGRVAALARTLLGRRWDADFRHRVWSARTANTDGCLSAQHARSRWHLPGRPESQASRSKFLRHGDLAPGPHADQHTEARPHAPPIVALDQDVDARARRGTTHEPILTDTAWATNLNTFAGRGGRLTFQAVSDPWFSAWDTTGYHGRLCEGQ
jgi:hypothetical protein